MAFWGRLGGNSDNHPDGNIALEKVKAVVLLWINGSANGGLTGVRALAELRLDAGEQTQVNRLKTALNALTSDLERILALMHIAAVINMHELLKYDHTKLTADEAGGQTVLSVEDTSKMKATDDVEVALDDTTIHQSTISSVDSPVQITIADPLASIASTGKVVTTQTKNSNNYDSGAAVEQSLVDWFAGRIPTVVF